MINTYKELKEYYDETINSKVGYNMERFKELPFRSSTFDINHSDFNSLTRIFNSQIKKLANVVIEINKNIHKENFSHNYNAIKEVYEDFKREKKDQLLSKTFSAYFSQLVNMADEVNFEYDEFQERLNKLSTSIKSSFLFLEKMASFINEYIQIEPYIKKSMYDKAQLSIYINELKDTCKDHSEIIKLAPDYLEIRSFDIINPHIIEFNSIKTDMLNKLKKEQPELLYSMSEFYNNDIKNHSGCLATFMLDKKHETTIVDRLTLTQSQKIQDFIVFEDLSVCYKKGGEYRVIANNEDYKNIFEELEYSIIDYQLRKKPKMAQYMAKRYKESSYISSNINLENVLIVIDTYLNNEQILKNMKMDLNIFEIKDFEGIDDYMHELINEHKLNQYANIILSNKNKHLLNNQSLASFKVLMESGVSKASIQNLIGKKLASINTPEDFEIYLEKVVDHISGFNKEILIDKLTVQNIELVYQKDNVIVFEVDTFEQSKLFGSPSWCISRSEYYFNDYKSDDNKQYFLYDFSRNEKDNQSMIGFTVQLNGAMVTQHARNDDYHEVDDFLKNIVNKIIYTHKSDYKLTDLQHQELEKQFGSTNTNKSKTVLSI